MSSRLRTGTIVACRTVIFDEFAKAGPVIFTSDEFEGFAKTLVASGGMVVLFAKDSESEVGGVGDVDAIFEE